MKNDRIRHLQNLGLMTEIATARQAVEFDQHTINDVGISASLLMENAGLAVAKKIIEQKERMPSDSLVIFFIGPGSNGADGVVAARHLLALNYDVTLYMTHADSRWNAALVEQINYLKSAIRCQTKRPWEQVIHAFHEHIQATLLARNASLILVDALFGAGLNRALDGIGLHAIKTISHVRKHHKHLSSIISVDIPSGLSLDAQTPIGEHIVCDHTVTFGHLKRAHICEPTKAACGKVTNVPIGLFANTPIETFYSEHRQTLSPLLRPINKNCHKGSFGHVLVCEGDQRYLGASRLAARASLRVGAGLVTLARSHNNLIPQNIDLAEFMHVMMDNVAQDLAKFDALVIGPGLSSDPELQKNATKLLSALATIPKKPKLVVDAGALPFLTDPSLNLNNLEIIATPHPKEAAQLLSCTTDDIQSNRFSAIEALSNLSANQVNHIVWVLKGATTLVRAPCQKTFAFRGDLPILATGGSGDVLSGAIAGLIKQTDSSLGATVLAISLQIEAATVLSQERAKGTLASELADAFPYLLKRTFIDEN